MRGKGPCEENEEWIELGQTGIGECKYMPWKRPMAHPMPKPIFIPVNNLKPIRPKPSVRDRPRIIGRRCKRNGIQTICW